MIDRNLNNSAQDIARGANFMDSIQTYGFVSEQNQRSSESKIKSRSFAKNAKAILRKNFEIHTDPIIQNPYRQISSSFIVGNKDRFGESYVPMKPHINIPGPGYYDSL